MATDTPEKGTLTSGSIETRGLIVSQPQKLKGLMEIISLLDKISESVGGPGEQWSGTGATPAGTQAGGAVAVSARDQAIANIPAQDIMQKQLKKGSKLLF